MIAILLVCTCVLTDRAGAYRLLYKEQLYQLYHRNLYNYGYKIGENIYYLEQIQQADFANPLYAIALIENNEQWRRYRNLFNMHIALLLVEQYMQLSSRYTKYAARFYNYPWRQQNIDSLTRAKEILDTARYYWQQAQEFSAAAWTDRALGTVGESHWINQNYRIENGLLDYAQIIDRHQRRIEQNIDIFAAMDERTY